MPAALDAARAAAGGDLQPGADPADLSLALIGIWMRNIPRINQDAEQLDAIFA